MGTLRAEHETTPGCYLLPFEPTPALHSDPSSTGWSTAFSNPAILESLRVRVSKNEHRWMLTSLVCLSIAATAAGGDPMARGTHSTGSVLLNTEVQSWAQYKTLDSGPPSAQAGGGRSGGVSARSGHRRRHGKHTVVIHKRSIEKIHFPSRASQSEAMGKLTAPS
jgi:hypothetical protein